MKFSSAFQAQKNLVSDKWSSYLPIYDGLLASIELPPRILEIGVQNGGSLEVWRRVFPASELILGIDIIPECVNLSFESEVSVEILDASLQETANHLQQKYGSFDLIIDDGSHKSEDVIRSFINLFPLLSHGGKYVVEDMHADYWSEFNGGLGNPLGAQSFFKKLIDLINFEHWALPTGPNEVFGPNSNVTPELANTLSRRIKRIEFQNSFCIITLCREGEENALGARVIRGDVAKINPAVTELNATQNVPAEQVPPKEYLEGLRDLETLISKTRSAEAELANVYSSLSWRISSPLRKFLELIKKL
jgi:hypothetical protein